MDCIQSHPFHPEIEDDWLLVQQPIDPKRPTLTSFFPEKGKGDKEKGLNSLSGFDCSQPFRVALPCSRRGHAAQPFSWRVVLQPM
jgi:hypothetical protein